MIQNSQPIGSNLESRISNRPRGTVSILGNENSGAVLVCGAGIAGMQAALDLAGSGFKVYLLDSAAAIGGIMARPETILPSGDCSMCILSPKLVECARNRNIEIITLADVLGVSGEPGNFKVKIRQNPRYVDLKKCEGCGICAEACPMSIPDEHGAATRKAISRPSPQAIPNVPAISKAPGTGPCKTFCPAGVNVDGCTALIASGRFTEAYDIIRQRCPIPASCGRVCPHPCESSCHRRSVDDALSFAGLERFIGDYILENPGLRPQAAPVTSAPGSRVAVIGSGPAGLTAANDLALMGYSVTVFESKPQPGGMLRYGIPGFRLPKPILDKEIQYIAGLGVEIKTEICIHKPEDLLKSSGSSDGKPGLGGEYQAVFVATGAWVDRKLGIPGDEARGVWGALDFLCELNEGRSPGIGPNVLVIGGTDLALDSARSALRLPGVQSVRLVCIESRDEMPAQPELIALAMDEGVVFQYGLGPTRVDVRGDDVASVTFRACTSVFENYRGYKRYNPIFDDSRISTLQADTVITAVGRSVNSARLGVTTRPDGRILADETTMATGTRGIFAGGEVVSGSASVANAIADGHRAADAIDDFIRESANIRKTDPARVKANTASPPVRAQCAQNPGREAVRKARILMPRAENALRLSPMTEVSLGYDRHQAISEAQRCLLCGLCSECMLCAKACPAGAIDHSQKPVETLLDVGSIILAPGSKEISERLGLAVDSSGFARAPHLAPTSSSRPGIYLAGARPEDERISESIIRGSAAAARAMEQLTAVRGTRVARHEYPWERDVADELPRIGVFVCRCGHNISSVIDVEGIAAKAFHLPGVCHAETSTFACSEANQQHIREMIRKHRLNRLVVASCSSPTHEVLFQETLRESGLNPYLFAMTSIRDQCSWVHRDEAAAAAAKAANVVSMAVARARHLRQLPLYELPVVSEALIVGGGLAGMTAAVNIAGQGYKVHLVEKESKLGGLLRNRQESPELAAAQSHLRQLMDKVQSHPGIRVYLNSELVRVSGQVGSFTSILSLAGKEMLVSHGVLVVATGGQENPAGQAILRRNPHGVVQSTLRPVDLYNEGQFVCGLAHSPCSPEEAIAQAEAAAARAARILSKPQLEIMGQVAIVNPASCVACATCVKTCPYGAPGIGEIRKAAIHSAKCMGCGSCVVACPARAITLQYQEGEAVTSMLDELLAGGGAR